MSLLVACDIDGTLIDTEASFTRIVLELSGATRAEVQALRDTGGFNDDWHLTRALIAWIGAGRPALGPDVCTLQALLARCGHDPGDQSARCVALYQGGYHEAEQALVSGALLERVAARHRVVACTGRDRAELVLAQARLGFVFADATTMEIARKPDPAALLRLHRGEDHVLLLGDTEADRQCAHAAAAETRATVWYFHASHAQPAQPLLEELTSAADPVAALTRWARALGAGSCS